MEDRGGGASGGAELLSVAADALPGWESVGDRATHVGGTLWMRSHRRAVAANGYTATSGSLGCTEAAGGLPSNAWGRHW